MAPVCEMPTVWQERQHPPCWLQTPFLPGPLESGKHVHDPTAELDIMAHSIQEFFRKSASQPVLIGIRG